LQELAPWRTTSLGWGQKRESSLDGAPALETILEAAGGEAGQYGEGFAPVVDIKSEEVVAHSMDEKISGDVQAGDDKISSEGESASTTPSDRCLESAEE
jgi:hypothetical protein